MTSCVCPQYVLSTSGQEEFLRMREEETDSMSSGEEYSQHDCSSNSSEDEGPTKPKRKKRGSKKAGGGLSNSDNKTMIKNMLREVLREGNMIQELLKEELVDEAKRKRSARQSPKGGKQMVMSTKARQKQVEKHSGKERQPPKPSTSHGGRDQTGRGKQDNNCEKGACGTKREGGKGEKKKNSTKKKEIKFRSDDDDSDSELDSNKSTSKRGEKCKGQERQPLKPSTSQGGRDQKGRGKQDNNCEKGTSGTKREEGKREKKKNSTKKKGMKFSSDDDDSDSELDSRKNTSMRGENRKGQERQPPKPSPSQGGINKKSRGKQDNDPEKGKRGNTRDEGKGEKKKYRTEKVEGQLKSDDDTGREFEGSNKPSKEDCGEIEQELPVTKKALKSLKLKPSQCEALSTALNITKLKRRTEEAGVAFCDDQEKKPDDKTNAKGQENTLSKKQKETEQGSHEKGAEKGEEEGTDHIAGTAHTAQKGGDVFVHKANEQEVTSESDSEEAEKHEGVRLGSQEDITWFDEKEKEDADAAKSAIVKSPGKKPEKAEKSGGMANESLQKASKEEERGEGSKTNQPSTSHCPDNVLLCTGNKPGPGELNAKEKKSEVEGPNTPNLAVPNRIYKKLPKYQRIEDKVLRDAAEDLMGTDKLRELKSNQPYHALGYRDEPFWPVVCRQYEGYGGCHRRYPTHSPIGNDSGRTDHVWHICSDCWIIAKIIAFHPRFHRRCQFKSLYE